MLFVFLLPALCIFSSVMGAIVRFGGDAAPIAVIVGVEE